ncbi:MAG: 4-hydroxyphenylpyruvate dioxygenase [Candidatus Niyogibacteria bacterium CG10_big_fil_rev_8_21_14_0_10_46_36]|uniref:4-hydroxyphenylpyruvate dioxygenase n=1 Tax=Candidatus Niyogibacteria bacterium CG10_big_fil_rev_8_21_14_0_10_46_36 TaxID=1974726 RepID=A0A2H0TEM2_9BACT|nr:MAG: 4-hydroxyphenylpyruvate dioxygenase [Candidatus Niyogibacteria bacterium CG10_big_fil_rev_8_21_14_0_10_46_36]
MPKKKPENKTSGTGKMFEGAKDFLPIMGTDYVEFYVGNAKQAAHYYQSAFGFQPLAYAGPETGVKDRASYVLQQGKIRLVFTSALYRDFDIGTHVLRHGDGVKVIALGVEDAKSAFEETVNRGAYPYMPPTLRRDKHGSALLSGIHTYGDTVHVFVERKNYTGPFLPGYKEWQPAYAPSPAGLTYIDHMVGNVELGKMNYWVTWYEKTMGFYNFLTFDDKQIHTEHSALMSKVMANGNGRIKFPINEPAPGKKKSQIQVYLDFYGGPGVQHIAVATDNIVKTVRKLRKRGVEFRSRPPETYYQEVPNRIAKHKALFKEDLEELANLGILVDADEDGYLLQIFTQTQMDRPTLFFEIIQRAGAKGFGIGNFKALFESIERDLELQNLV